MHEEILKVVDFRDRGKKTANFHVLRETAMPALLTENGFVDNTNDAEKVLNSHASNQTQKPAIQSKAAKA